MARARNALDGEVGAQAAHLSIVGVGAVARGASVVDGAALRDVTKELEGEDCCGEQPLGWTGHVCLSGEL